MRALAFVLLAACGGQAAPPATTTTTTTTASADSSGEEDWRGRLAQLAGGTCRWIPGASFLYCKFPGEDGGAALIGWEPRNRRYVSWLVEPDGAVRVFPGTAGASEWSFADADARITLRREAPGWNLQMTTAGGDVVFASLIETSGAATPPAPATPGTVPDSEDWRSQIEPLVATWTFTGVVVDQHVTYEETCRWITAATFVLCKRKGSDSFSMLGFEPHNRRYVHYRFPPSGPTVQPATVTRGSWTIDLPTERLTMRRESPIKFAVRAETRGADGSWKVTVDGVYETDPAGIDSGP